MFRTLSVINKKSFFNKNVTITTKDIDKIFWIKNIELPDFPEYTTNYVKIFSLVCSVFITQ